MWKKTAIATVVAAAAVLGMRPVSATAEGPVLSPSACAECCEGDALCQALAGLADLRASVDELVPDAGIAFSLDVKVDATTASVLASRITPALGQLDAFGNEVDGLESAGRLSAETSNVLKAKHDAVKGSINNTR